MWNLCFKQKVKNEVFSLLNGKTSVGQILPKAKDILYSCSVKFSTYSILNSFP